MTGQTFKANGEYGNVNYELEGSKDADDLKVVNYSES
ncbi:Uncharacterised protein [Staphylococcus gallinarum]|uniref:Uncharacterized protein n=1 Tax=Staphylococcus gallinarum TaxID=1293 RepID=A0A380FN87_STAGA|nr:Uncharacterised protein [Staphylococcus gallinarum]